MIESRTVGVVLIEGKKVLLVRHLAGSNAINDMYGLPSGHVEDGETDIEAAERELEEETGLVATADDLKELPLKYHAVLKRKTSEEAMVMTVFECKKYEGSLMDSDETAPEWVEIEKLPAMNLQKNVHNAILQALEADL